MEIEYGEQISIDAIPDQLDLFILAGNHEKRKFALYDTIASAKKIDNTLLLCYKDEFRCDTKHKSIVPKKLNSHEDIFSLLTKAFEEIQTDSISIFVDYSCMTKSWYYSIILYLKNKIIKSKQVTIFFGYTPSKYSTPQPPKPNKTIAPLPGNYFVPTDKPKALIVCLGYEENKAVGIIDHLDPKIYYLFYTKPALDPKFVKSIEENNASLLKEKPANTITFPFSDLLSLERELTALYYKLKDEFSIIIAPLGPKPFTLMAMLMAMKYKGIDIWRVGSGSDINEYPREALEPKQFLISKIIWSEKSHKTD
ncbi:hypothetical protein GWC95_15725 [Sediminibacterium roseum]|uniref:Uncharacterized protein n=1 Tax=Sediminibacterium roseum TaxID=1978412 RepID=A0ABW9ZW50_9BACT|nr:hypothetical protein [Sediminibacterium roseum]NCI51378.1 hypothetical protein [Sediminibacterium roseum]